MEYDRDLIVIGGGAAGLTAAGMAAVLGARTTLIEGAKLGGDCTWYGCVPSKSLIHAAKVAHSMRHAAALGLTAADPAHDLGQVLHKVRTIRQEIYEDADAPPQMEKLGVEVLAGWAQFVDPHTVEVAHSEGGKQRLTAKRFVIATGGRARSIDLPDDGNVPVLTNESLFEITSLPKRFVVLGSGPIGMEMAQAFHRLGAEVTVVNRSPGILKRDDTELSQLLLKRLTAEGLGFHFGATPKRIADGRIHLSDGTKLPADAILLAAGRQPNVDSLNLQTAGVRTNTAGIVINDRCRSSASHIYACGDVAGRHQFTHMAEHMAKTAVMNALLHFPARIDERHVTWATFTDPELAHVGQTEEQISKSGRKYRVYRFPFEKLDRAITESQPVGLVKVVAKPNGKILGASILGAHAGEMIAEFAVAMRNGVTLSQISSTIHAYPTYSLGNRRAADKHATAWLNPRLVRWIQRIFGLRGSAEGISVLNAS